MTKMLFDGPDWNLGTIEHITEEAEKIGKEEFGLELYPNQIEIISSEQMLDAYSSVGLPLMYKHWSFGKRFLKDDKLYKHGIQGLAYEIVINSSPCISYLMEENTATMQALVISHACCGHNSVFKNNVYFKLWSDAKGILEYLSYAKEYVAQCEEKHGLDAVERILDAAHALQNQGIDRYPRRAKGKAEIREQEAERQKHKERSYNKMWDTLPNRAPVDPVQVEADALRAKMNLPEENLLYFVEKYSPKLQDWERELVRIVRKMAQYFYPQGQTKVLNEGMATFTHYEMMSLWHERGQISNGSLLEFLHSHSNVVGQQRFDSPYFNGFNPYALGYAICKDIKRISLEPTSEDKEWFPRFAGNGDVWGNVRQAVFDHRDEGFILEYLSPKVMRDLRMFEIHDPQKMGHYAVGDIHNDTGYRKIRRSLAKLYNTAYMSPEMHVIDVDILGDRQLQVQYTMRDGRMLHEDMTTGALMALSTLWGYSVRLFEKNADDESEEMESTIFDASEDDF